MRCLPTGADRGGRLPGGRAVLPGNIATPMIDRFTGGDIQKAIDLKPVGRLGKPEEIAEAVLWMASELGGLCHRRSDGDRRRLVAVRLRLDCRSMTPHGQTSEITREGSQ